MSGGFSNGCAAASVKTATLGVKAAHHAPRPALSSVNVATVGTVSNLVSGEAVELELRHAQFPSRGVALLIDAVVQFTALAVLLGVLYAAAPALDDAMFAAISLTVVVAVMIGYPVTFETLTHGRTPGKFVMGLRVTRDDGGPVSFRHALIRGLSGFFVDIWLLGLFGTVAVVVSLLSPQSKRVGDYLAGTIVIRERLPAATGTQRPSAQRAEWTATLDLSGLSADLMVSIRQYLTRAETFSAAARAEIGQSLVREVSAHIGRTPPDGVTDDEYLEAIITERRAREEQRRSHRAVGDSSAAHPDSPFPPPG